MSSTYVSRTEDPEQSPRGRLQGRRVVITGAAGGIGRATAELFAREGATLALLDRDLAGAEKTAELTGSSCFQVDVVDEESVTRAVLGAASSLGGIDGLVNTAGIMFRGLALDVPVEDWRRVLEINLTGTYVVTRSCLPSLLRAPAATIVNIASGQGLLPNSPGYTAYAASKGGVINLTRALATEVAPTVRVNSVCPGMVDTQMADGYRSNAEHYALKRIAEPAEIAQAIAFLTSSDSSYITGAALAVDGGRTFH